MSYDSDFRHLEDGSLIFQDFSLREYKLTIVSNDFIQVFQENVTLESIKERLSKTALEFTDSNKLMLTIQEMVSTASSLVQQNDKCIIETHKQLGLVNFQWKCELTKLEPLDSQKFIASMVLGPCFDLLDIYHNKLKQLGSGEDFNSLPANIDSILNDRQGFCSSDSKKVLSLLDVIRHEKKVAVVIPEETIHDEPILHAESAENKEQAKRKELEMKMVQDAPKKKKKIKKLL